MSSYPYIVAPSQREISEQAARRASQVQAVRASRRVRAPSRFRFKPRKRRAPRSQPA